MRPQKQRLFIKREYLKKPLAKAAFLLYNLF